MPAALLGRKLGMTRYFTEEGKNVPVTVIEAGPCAVTQVKTVQIDGYPAIQIGFVDLKPRRSTMPMIGHDAKAGVGPQRVHRELRLGSDEEAAEHALGDRIDVSVFENVKYVDVLGTCKGKGFQGVMKRHGFKGQQASHGVERKHRSPGSIGGHATNRGFSGKLKKGKKMGGHMGNERVTVRSCEIIRIDPERNLMLVKGPVPGHNQAQVQVRPAVRLNRSKARKASA